MAGKKVLSVGQCDFDHGNIAGRLKALFGATLLAVDSAQEALEVLARDQFDLILVNRVFDADGGSGLDLIRELNSGQNPPRMLVSNFSDAQDQAVASGAVRGFGKAGLQAPSIVDLLKPFLG